MLFPFPNMLFQKDFFSLQKVCNDISISRVRNAYVRNRIRNSVWGENSKRLRYKPIFRHDELMENASGDI